MKKNAYQSLMAGVALFMTLQQAIAGGSGFIEDGVPLTEDPDRAGTLIWQKPGLNLAGYSGVMIEPITVFISPDSEYKGLKADDLKALADGFHEAISGELEPEFPVVTQGGPGVLYIRAALTRVKLVKKKRSLLGYTPIGLVVTAAETAAGENISVREALLEVEMLDSVSGERLGVLIDPAPDIETKDEHSWEAVTKTFDYYAKRLKARIQAAQKNRR